MFDPFFFSVPHDVVCMNVSNFWGLAEAPIVDGMLLVHISKHVIK